MTITATDEQTSPPQPDADGVTSLSEWKQAATHLVTLYSGARVRIRIPDLGALLRNDLIPEQLRGVALRRAFSELEDFNDAPAAGGESGTRMSDADRYKTAKDLANLIRALVIEMVVEPKFTEQDYDELPGEDKELLAMLAQRERDTDALGVVLGVEPLDRWATFRRHHGCATPCPACEALTAELSTHKRPGLV